MCIHILETTKFLEIVVFEIQKFSKFLIFKGYNGLLLLIRLPFIQINNV